MVLGQDDTMQHTCSLSVHDDSVSDADVLLNLSILPSTTLAQGDTVQLVSAADLEHEVHSSPVPTKQKSRSRKREQDGALEQPTSSKTDGELFGLEIPRLNSQSPDITSGYFFVCKDITPDMKPKLSNAQVSYLKNPESRSTAKVFGVQVSMSTRISSAFNLKSRSSVRLRKASFPLSLKKVLSKWI